MRSIQKNASDLNPRRRFPCYESSPELNFTFVPNHSSQYKGSLIQGQTTSRIKGHYFTLCKHAGMFICTTHVENR